MTVTEPYDYGLLDVGDDQRVYWECCGNPDGVPTLMVHGGPGSGCSTRMRNAVDLTRHRLILFDQRGCGRSRPHAGDPSTALDANTTHHLLADIERLREHHGVRRWLLVGGSWGSTLMLAYAQRHPRRVSGVIISGVTTSRRTEIDWLYRGAGRFFPAEQRRFRTHVPEASDELFGEDGVLAAYARRCAHPDPEIRERAVAQWCEWENALLAHETNGRPGAFGAGRSTRDRLALVRICAHYYSHAAWLEEDTLLRAAPRLAGIPSVLVHGRLDLSCPLDTAWALAEAWPDAELVVIEDSGHTGSPAMREELRRAYRNVADRAST